VCAVQTGYDSFDWTALETLLNTIASRGHQALLKFYYDNPAKPSGVPEFLSHVPVNPYSTYQETTPEESRSVSPDYEHPDLQRSMLSFIAAFGARYDGDPRIGFIELGLIGFWGEWHTYPYSEWMPTINTQNAVMEAYDNAFNLTCILVREPRGNSPAYNIGYHDDSFVHITFIYQADVGDLPDGAITLAVRLKNPLPNGDPVVFANANPDTPAPGWQRIGTYNRTPVIRPIVSHSVSAGQTIQIKVTATDPDGDAPAFSATGE